MVQGKPRRELPSVEHQVAVDLVGHHDEAVPGGDPGERGQLFGGPDAPHRVLRGAQERHPGFRLGRQLLEALEVQAVGVRGGVLRPVLPAERTEEHPATVVADRPEEREIDRRVEDDPLPRLDKGANQQTQVGDDSLGGDDPVGVRTEPVAGRHPVAEGLPVARRPHAVAEDRMPGAPADRFDHDFRTRKVHVGDPHGDHVGIFGGDECGTVADRALAVFPLHRSGARAGDEAVEIGV